MPNRWLAQPDTSRSSIAVASATAAGNVGTFTLAAAPDYRWLNGAGLQVGQQIRVAGMTQTGYNGIWTIASVVSATEFTAALASAPSAESSATGFVAPYKAWAVFGHAVFTDTTTWHYTPAPTHADELGPVLFVVTNGMDQSVNAQCQGTLDGANWVNIGSQFAVAAGASVAQTLTDPWGLVRVGLQAAVAPTSGEVDVGYAVKEDM